MPVIIDTDAFFIQRRVHSASVLLTFRTTREGIAIHGKIRRKETAKPEAAFGVLQ